MIRIARLFAGILALVVAGAWAVVALRGRGGCSDCPEYGRDPETGLVLRVGPLSAAERAAALERENQAATVRA